MQSAQASAPVLSRVRDVLHHAMYRMAGSQQPARRPGAFPVGFRCMPLGPLATTVWYPAALGMRESAQLYSRIYIGLGSREAPLNCLRQWPLVLMSHGLGGNRYDLSWLAEGLAAHGCVVASIDHAGSTDQRFDPHQAIKLWQRAGALSQTIDGMLAHPVFGPYIDPERIAVAGHSAGGSTALVLAGAQIDAARFVQRYPMAGMPPATSAHDPRIRAVIALAPGTGPVFTRTGLQRVHSPALIISGTGDTHTPDSECAGHYTEHLPHAVWHSIPHAGHFTFKPVCVQYGHRRTHEICSDHASIDRRLVHRQIVQWTADFLLLHGVAL